MERKHLILRLALATIIGMPLIALAVDHFSDDVRIANALIGDGQFALHVVYGLIAGMAIAVPGYWISTRPWMGRVHHQYARLIQQFNLNNSDILFISCCAGIGEEILFRGAIQPFLGVVLTAIFFVAIHGYLNPRDWRISVYGIFMTAGIALLGYLAETKGLLVAIVAHTVIDIYLLKRMVNQSMPPSAIVSETPENSSYEQEDERP
jgi:uncharacterized protein